MNKIRANHTIHFLKSRDEGEKREDGEAKFRNRAPSTSQNAISD
jgi:hypothetical protein